MFSQRTHCLSLVHPTTSLRNSEWNSRVGLGHGDRAGSQVWYVTWSSEMLGTSYRGSGVFHLPEWLLFLGNVRAIWTSLFYSLIKFLLQNWAPSPGRQGSRPMDIICGKKPSPLSTWEHLSTQRVWYLSLPGPLLHRCFLALTPPQNTLQSALNEFSGQLLANITSLLPMKKEAGRVRWLVQDVTSVFPADILNTGQK